jgi:membrane-associated phospholipid phosphatase
VVDRLVGRGFSDLHMNFASALIKAGQGGVDEVAAVPSLHAGGIMLFSIFMWPRLNKWWRPLLLFYPLFMVFTLVYTAEHYISDCLAGWLAAALVALAARGIERWRKRRRRPDTLESPSETAVETSSCPPTRSLPATTPSST